MYVYKLVVWYMDRFGFDVNQEVGIFLNEEDAVETGVAKVAELRARPNDMGSGWEIEELPVFTKALQ